jgi:hypothetical protein
MHYYGKEETYVDKFHRGVTFYLDNSFSIVVNAPLETHFDISRTVRSCEDGENDYKQFIKIKNLGDIYVEPVIANLQNSLTSERFHLIMGPNVSLYSCKDYTSRLTKRK